MEEWKDGRMGRLDAAEAAGGGAEASDGPSEARCEGGGSAGLCLWRGR